jgi:hypothetical protein
LWFIGESHLLGSCLVVEKGQKWSIWLIMRFWKFPTNFQTLHIDESLLRDQFTPCVSTKD